MRSEGGAQSAIVESRELIVLAAVAAIWLFTALDSCAFTHTSSLFFVGAAASHNEFHEEEAPARPRGWPPRREAQEGQIAEAAARSKIAHPRLPRRRPARFATRFAPEALLRRAGVDALLRDLIARTSQNTQHLV